MHPIVIIAGDKDPAIGAAVDGLQAAGFEVRVLNTATAKLVDFLGALAGADDDEDEEEKKPDAPADDAAPKDEPKADKPPKEEAPAEEPPAEDDPLDPAKMEALIAGEPVTVEIVDGADIVLHPSSIQAGAKTFYSLNESQFSFWPSAVSDEPITGGVELVLNGNDTGHLTKVTFSEQTANPPVIKIGRDWLAANT